MKARDQTYRQDAASLLRDISMYRVLRKEQLLRLYPGKEQSVRMLLDYLVKQSRIYHIGTVYCTDPSCADSVDWGLLAAVWVLVDFIDRVEFHSIGEFPAKVIFIADGNSRFTGLLLCESTIFVVYNTSASQMKWEYKAEMRLKSFLEIELCLHRLPGQFAGVKQSAIIFGANMGCLLPLIGMDSDNRQSYFLSGEGFARFHYLTSDHYGDVVLQLLCEPDKRAALDSILSEGLSPPQPGLVIENDAMNGDSPVLFGYTCDMPRIKRFDNALRIHRGNPAH